MKTEFNREELESYLENLSPAEMGMVSIEIKMAFDCVIDMHFEEYDSISLIELVSLIAQDHSDCVLENQEEA